MSKIISCHVWYEIIKNEQVFHNGLPFNGDHFAIGRTTSMSVAAVAVCTQEEFTPGGVLACNKRFMHRKETLALHHWDLGLSCSKSNVILLITSSPLLVCCDTTRYLYYI